MTINLNEIVSNLVNYMVSNDTTVRNKEDLSDILINAKQEEVIPILSKEEYYKY